MKHKLLQLDKSPTSLKPKKGEKQRAYKGNTSNQANYRHGVKFDKSVFYPSDLFPLLSLDARSKTRQTMDRQTDKNRSNDDPVSIGFKICVDEKYKTEAKTDVGIEQKESMEDNDGANCTMYDDANDDVEDDDDNDRITVDRVKLDYSTIQRRKRHVDTNKKFYADISAPWSETLECQFDELVDNNNIKPAIVHTDHNAHALVSDSEIGDQLNVRIINKRCLEEIILKVRKQHTCVADETEPLLSWNIENDYASSVKDDYTNYIDITGDNRSTGTKQQSWKQTLLPPNELLNGSLKSDVDRHVEHALLTSESNVLSDTSSYLSFANHTPCDYLDVDVDREQTDFVEEENVGNNSSTPEERQMSTANIDQDMQGNQWQQREWVRQTPPGSAEVDKMPSYTNNLEEHHRKLAYMSWQNQMMNQHVDPSVTSMFCQHEMHPFMYYNGVPMFFYLPDVDVAHVYNEEPYRSGSNMTMQQDGHWNMDGFVNFEKERGVNSQYGRKRLPPIRGDYLNTLHNGGRYTLSQGNAEIGNDIRYSAYNDTGGKDPTDQHSPLAYNDRKLQANVNEYPRKAERVEYLMKQSSPRTRTIVYGIERLNDACQKTSWKKQSMERSQALSTIQADDDKFTNQNVSKKGLSELGDKQAMYNISFHNDTHKKGLDVTFETAKRHIHKDIDKSRRGCKYDNGQWQRKVETAHSKISTWNDKYIPNSSKQSSVTLPSIGSEYKVTDPRKFGSIAHIRQLKSEKGEIKTRISKAKSKLNTWQSEDKLSNVNALCFRGRPKPNHHETNAKVRLYLL